MSNYYVSICQSRSGMLSFKKYVIGRCSLFVSMKKSTRPDAVSWQAVKDNLHLSLEELECLNQLTAEFDQQGIISFSFIFQLLNSIITFR